MIAIRLARQEDLETLRDIAIACFVDTFDTYNSKENMTAYLDEAYSRARFDEEWHDKEAVCFLAWDDESLVGFVRVRQNSEPNDYLGTNHVEVQRLYVVPQHKGKKIGSLLMEQVLTYAKAQHFDWVWLGVWERNFNAQKFYAHWGFEKFSQHVFQMGDDPQIDWLLKKKLN